MEGFWTRNLGVAINIGIHFYDMLHFIFGEVKRMRSTTGMRKCRQVILQYERARVRWFLSIDASYCLITAAQGEKSTYRSIDIEGEELEFSGGFTDLHTQSYLNILAEAGFGIDENRTAIATVSVMRKMPIFRYCFSSTNAKLTGDKCYELRSTRDCCCG